jgi:hypothetical protein
MATGGLPIKPSVACRSKHQNTEHLVRHQNLEQLVRHTQHSNSEPRSNIMEALASIMAFCEAPFEGTLVPPPAVPARHGASSSTPEPRKSGGDDAAASVCASSTSKRQAASNQPSHAPMQELVATMAFCEAPFEGTLALPVSAGRGASTPVPEKKHGAETRLSSLAAAVKHRISSNPARPQQVQQQQSRRGTVDGLAIFETLVLE